jgi:hypothetical protein
MWYLPENGSAGRDEYTWICTGRMNMNQLIEKNTRSSYRKTNVDQLIGKNTRGIFTGSMGGRPRSNRKRMWSS